ncbi:MULTISPECIES: MarR family winged helix-turn-helix transcriptional regulator [Streptomyces]|uniref:MarR family winged helix-turn-helix transcriptional regulator n=1 Tax=Streptomyces TaxID=1883 RepID=UPI000D5074C9|nr:MULTISPECIES: MarR family winged helix-turn-helix transcriptional regulator [Streptomyces]MXG25731.1 MarR family transcriptional regulator [Streptomyces sp. YIM 132580]NYS20074.1 winged helix-turn-helix transcriptional regulator [Streptomyces sp. SJ1-7]PVC64815.1 MarR family transcriptional regulator [Streptomyces sp. CS065A]
MTRREETEGCRRTAASAGSITELLDVLWESARNATAREAAPGSTSQLRLMYVIDREGSVRMRTVCRLLAAAPPSVSRMCDRLQAIGFLERAPCPDSGREVMLRLTAEGQRHLRRIRERRDTMLHEAIAGMPPAERRALASGLAELESRLTATRDPDDGARPGRAA